MVTDKFLDLIFPSKEHIEYRNARIPYANNIIYHSLIVFGFPASGKTTLVNSLAGYAVDKYGERDVNASYSENGDLKNLIKTFDPKLVNVLYTDNATLAKYDADTLHNYFMLRNITYDKYGITNCYILSIIALHRYYSIPVEFRSIIDGIIIRDTSLNPYDNTILKRFINNDELYDLMRSLTVARNRNRNLMNLSVFVGKSLTGLIEIKPRDKFFFTEKKYDYVSEVFFRKYGLAGN